jgi:DNA-binding transcriptional ArsR family regulator
VEYLPGPATSELCLAEVLAALADPVRLWMVGLLASTDGERSCSLNGFPADLHKSTLSHHFKVLRAAGITRTRLDGRNRYVALRREDLHARFPGLLDAVIAGAGAAYAAGGPLPPAGRAVPDDDAPDDAVPDGDSGRRPGPGDGRLAR